MTIHKRIAKRLIGITLVLFLLMNVVAIFHSYKLTHFASSNEVKTKDPKKLSASEKVLTLIFGVSNPRPANRRFPDVAFETIVLEGSKKTECWSMKVDHPRGTVVLFHGFGGQKSSLLDKAAVFREQGFNTLLVDFMGAGGSEGNQTTIGYLEADQVKVCYDYLVSRGEQHIFLFGTSMGAVAIMKAIHDFGISPQGIIIECPFGSMYQTVCARFKIMNAPVFPMAGLLVFWGGVQNGFWAFGHNPVEYAKKISCPVLFMYGQRDDKVSRQEVNEIWANLKGEKELKVYEQAGHENYLLKYKEEWTKDVTLFLDHQTTASRDVVTHE